MIPKIRKAALVLGAVVFMAGCAATEKIALDPESRVFYETARLVMVDAEKDIFNHLPDTESRREFIKDFWTKRDPDPDTEGNEFKEEFESRLDYAQKHFKEGRRGWNTDRGRLYVYLGPPEKTEEFISAPTQGIRGSLIWWIYYQYDLGIEFVDEKGVGEYTINEITGDLVGAIEAAQLGAVYQEEGSLRRKYANFDVTYDRAKKELILSLPAKTLNFRVDGGLLKADFEFEFFVYQQGAARKQTFKESRPFEGKEQDVEKMKEIFFTFACDLSPGKNFIDVIVTGKEIGKSRKIFTIKN